MNKGPSLGTSFIHAKADIPQIHLKEPDEYKFEAISNPALFSF